MTATTPTGTRRENDQRGLLLGMTSPFGCDGSGASGCLRRARDLRAAALGHTPRLDVRLDRRRVGGARRDRFLRALFRPMEEDRRAVAFAEALGEAEVVGVQVRHHQRCRSCARSSDLAHRRVESLDIGVELPARVDHMHAALGIPHQIRQRERHAPRSDAQRQAPHAVGDLFHRGKAPFRLGEELRLADRGDHAVAAR
ncbi:hypothetical protein MK786_12575 [Microbacterium sp. CFH 31415]|nr:hypothetical protein [Microbacterium sp. CFH 31415]MCH6231577.1 hypothetical protein [Microbacterium sp. CFH 31415]